VGNSTSKEPTVRYVGAHALHTHTHTHTHACTHARMHARTRAHARTHPRAHARTHAHTHTHTHARTRTHAHTHTHIFESFWVVPTIFLFVNFGLGQPRPLSGGVSQQPFSCPQPFSSPEAGSPPRGGSLREALTLPSRVGAPGQFGSGSYLTHTTPHHTPPHRPRTYTHRETAHAQTADTDTRDGSPTMQQHTTKTTNTHHPDHKRNPTPLIAAQALTLHTAEPPWGCSRGPNTSTPPSHTPHQPPEDRRFRGNLFPYSNHLSRR